MKAVFALLAVCALLMVAMVPAWGKVKGRSDTPSPIDQLIESAMKAQNEHAEATTSGSLWNPAAHFGDVAADLRASRVGDLVTILVSERASAITKGAVQSARNSKVNAGVTAAAGIKRAAGPLANLAGASSSTSLDGQGTSSRETELTTTVAARVTHALPNGLLVVEGYKNVVVNSDNQVITVRGVVRQVDLSTANMIDSDHVADLEVKINGKGVVSDSIRRPFILYRILMGILPF